MYDHGEMFQVVTKVSEKIRIAAGIRESFVQNNSNGCIYRIYRRGLKTFQPKACVRKAPAHCNKNLAVAS